MPQPVKFTEEDTREYLEFLERQFNAGTELARRSDLVDIHPACSAWFRSDRPASPSPEQPPPTIGPIDTYFIQFNCKGLVKKPNGEIGEAERFQVVITFPPLYMRRAEMGRILTWMEPLEVFHPNILGPRGAVCVGHLEPRTELVDLIHQLHQIITYANVTVDERDCLNPDAAQWARRRMEMFPVDRRPLVRETKTNVND